MEFNFGKQSQFELFPAQVSPSTESQRLHYPFQTITLAPENMVVVCIAVMMSVILSFSLGVERGKVIQPSAKNLTVQNKNNVIIPPQSQPVNTPAVNTAIPKTGNVVNQRPVTVSPVNAAVVAKIELELPKKIAANYTIQVASFKSPKSAEKEASVLKQIGLDTFVMSKGSHLVVCVGKFAEAEQAKSFSNKLKYRYKDNVVRRL